MNIVEYIVRTSLVVVCTAVYGTAFLLHRLLGGTTEITYSYTRAWCRLLFKLTGVELQTEGGESLTAGESYIFIANHASLFDIPALQNALPGNVRIMYKRELQKIPFMGWMLRFSSFVPIVRERARDAASTVERTVNAIRHDESSLMVFAEGTRTADGRLQAFKRGAVVLAMKSGKPIVPVAIVNSFSILPKHTLRYRKGSITVRIGAPMHLEEREYSREEEIHMAHTVHTAVDELLRSPEGQG